MNIKTDKMSIDKLMEVFQYSDHTSLSEAIILSAISINKRSRFLPVEDFRNNVFSLLWKQQFHHGANWTAQYRSEMNQGPNRLAFRVFESPSSEGWKYRVKDYSLIDKKDLPIVKKLEQIVFKIENGDNLLSDNDEEVFQNAVQISKPFTLPTGKVEKPKKRQNASVSEYSRNPKLSKSALITANYKCEYNESHQTFTSQMTGRNYTEAHHLIPMGRQEEYSYSIDVPENVISLCPNCHRKIHKAIMTLKKEMLKKLFTTERKEQLEKRGISITDSKLLEYYK